MAQRSHKKATQSLSNSLRPLPALVAKVLHVESNKDAHLKPENIEIEFVPFPPVTKNTKNVAIRIEATNFPERVATRTERTEAIYDFVKAVLPQQLSVSVWLTLVESAYIESED